MDYKHSAFLSESKIFSINFTLVSEEVKMVSKKVAMLKVKIEICCIKLFRCLNTSCGMSEVAYKLNAVVKLV